jgi:glycosyltransferase involved in cell wall biosynthesis
MHILYLTTTGTLGGAELCLLDVMASLRKSRPDWGLSLIAGEGGALVTEAEALGVSCRVMPVPPSVARLGDAGLKDRSGKSRGRLALAAAAAPAAAPAAAYLGRLKRAIREANPDRVHTNGMKAHVLGAWASPREVPVVWHLHDYIGSRAVMARLLRLVARPGITGVAVSHSVAADAAAALGPRVAVKTAYNAVDLLRFAPEGPRVDLDSASGLPAAPAGTVRVGLVGTFARWKGQDVLLEAASRVGPSAPARFYIVGGPIYRTAGSQWTIEELKAMAGRLGVADRVGFAGYQPDPSSAIRGLDVVVHASTRPEPFGRVIVEGMACAKAVIAVDSGGSAELFDDGATALGVPRGDPAALASAVCRLAADTALRSALGSAGRASVARRFDRDGLADAWSAIYAAG